MHMMSRKVTLCTRIQKEHSQWHSLGIVHRKLPSYREGKFCLSGKESRAIGMGNRRNGTLVSESTVEACFLLLLPRGNGSDGSFSLQGGLIAANSPPPYLVLNPLSSQMTTAEAVSASLIW